MVALLLLQGACAGPRTSEAAATAALGSGGGWVEVTIADRRIPADPIAQLAGHPLRPPTCTLEIELDGTTVLSEQLQPTGASPPYSVRSTFQLPVAAGEYDADFIYSGCRSVGQRRDSVRAGIRFPVHVRQTTRIRFDGARIEAEFPTAPTREVVGP
jgi:hypothetical protein